MTDDLSLTTENTSNEVEYEPSESVEESARALYEEVIGDAGEETDKSSARGEGAAEKPTELNDVSKAASLLAKSRKAKTGKQAEQGGTAQVVKPELSGETGKLQPPQGWSVENKEWFNRQSREVQEENLRQYKGMQGQFTKLSQDLNREKTRYSNVNQTIDNYVSKWGRKGWTPEVVSAELFATHDRLLAEDTRVSEVARIMKDTSTTLEEVHAYLTGSAPAHQPAQQQQSGLTREEVARIVREEREGLTREQAEVAAAQEIDQLRHEQDGNGRYIYPELWDPNNTQGNHWNVLTWQRVQPLIEAARKTNPGLSMREITRRSLDTLRLLDGGQSTGSPSPTATRLTQADEIAKARSASVSVRPRGNGAIPTMTSAKKGESVKESAEALWATFNNSSH